MKDWMIRAIKTFVQSFFGVMIPEAALLMKEGFPESGEALRAAVMPVVCAALAAAISAVWNLMLEAAGKEK